MSLSHGKSDRRIIPRWRGLKNFSSSQELKSLKPNGAVGFDFSCDLNDSKFEFDDGRNLGVASELMSTAILAGNSVLAAEAASFVLERESTSPSTLIAMAKGVLGGRPAFGGAFSDSEVSVSRVRAALRIRGDNPMLWSELARHYASLGHKERSLRCMKTALALAPNNRSMLRTASRFYVHQEDPLMAHKILSSHPRTKSDPWLIAAELACSQVVGRQPKYWRQASNMLQYDNFSPIHISELATAVAMLELEAGDKKQAKKLIKKGLIDPTENTLAQVYWASENKHLNDGFHLDALVQSADYAFEADYQRQMLNGNLLKARSSALIWAEDEPFAARPCNEIAYVSSILDDHIKTIKMAEKVKLIDGHISSSLELNSIFAKLSMIGFGGNFDELDALSTKHKLLGFINDADGSSYHAVANLGLWLYRCGNPDAGHDAYEQSINIAQKFHHTESAAMASIFAAREAILARRSDAEVCLQRARDLTLKSKNKAAIFYIRKLNDLIVRPDLAATILSLGSAEKYINRVDLVDSDIPRLISDARKRAGLEG